MAILSLLTTELTATPQSVTDIIISDLASPRGAIDFGDPSYGYAQEFTVTSGTWNIFQAQINLGDGAGLPGSPLLQVRNYLGAGLAPGTEVLGSFTMNPNDIPTGFNFANIVATANNDFILGPGTYWLCFGNDLPTGGFWVAFADDGSLVQDGISGIVNMDTVAQSGDGGQTFGTPSLGGYDLIFGLQGQPVPEASTLSLLGIGFVFLGWNFVRR